MANVPNARKRDFLELLEAAKPQVALLLPEHVKIERVMRVARSTYLNNPELHKCSNESVLRVVMTACELGLEIGGGRKHAYAVPYRNKGEYEAQFVIGYNGVLELARRTGEFADIGTRVVGEHDVFTLEYNPAVVFRHIPNLDTGEGKAKGVYAYAKLKSGETAFEFMSRDQIEAIRNRLPEFARSSPAWRDFWGEKARNVVLKRMLKRCPSSVELADAIDRDNELDRPEQLPGPVDDRPALSRTDALAERLGISQDVPVPTPVDVLDASSEDAEERLAMMEQ